MHEHFITNKCPETADTHLNETMPVKQCLGRSTHWTYHCFIHTRFICFLKLKELKSYLSELDLNLFKEHKILFTLLKSTLFKFDSIAENVSSHAAANNFSMQTNHDSMHEVYHKEIKTI